MNGQQPEENLAAGGQGVPPPASFGSAGMGFGGTVPPQSSWNPENIPAPGPVSLDSAPVPAPQPVASGVSQPAASAPQPMVMPSQPVTPPAPAAPHVIPAVPPSVGSAIPPSSTNAQFEVRTMKSDMESMKQSGGGAPTPQSFSPQTMNGGETAFNPAAAAPKKGGKGVEKIIIISVVVLAVVAAGVLGYMFLKPLFAPIVAPTPAPVIPEEVTTSKEVIPPPVPVEEQTAAAPATHVSLFTLPADSTEDRVLPALALADVKAAFVPVEGATSTASSIREVVLKSGNDFVNFSSFISTVLPSFNAAAVSPAFTPDFTLFIYRDKAVDLPGFIVKVDPSATPESLAAFSTALETAALGNLYPEDPGTLGEFKASAINGTPIKYGAFSKAGYAFDYGWFKAADGAQYLIVSASYAGMKEAVRRAGF